MCILLHMLPLGSAWFQWDSQRRGQEVMDSLFTHDSCYTLLLGNDGAGKTSLAFQAAVSLVAEKQQVIFIRPKVLSSLPLPVHGMPTPQSAALQHVKFWYPDQAEEVVKWCGHIHMQTLLPDVIIIDDFDVFCAQSKNAEHGAAHLCASLLDAAQWITTKSGHCHVLITAGHRISSLPSVCRQFHFTEVKVTEGSGEDGAHQLTCITGTCRVSVSFIITRQHIMLQSVHKSPVS